MGKQVTHPEKQVAYMEFLNRENQSRHHYYAEEMKQYVLMQAGDPAAVEESVRMMSGNLHGHLSDDPVRNVKYLFVANITITTRFAIEGGMDSETAYNSSDLYINRMDLCGTVEEVMELHREMFTYFTNRMAQLKQETVYSKPVIQCMEYVREHLNEPVRVSTLAKITGLSDSYLSTLFRREVGIPFSEYLLRQRIETAKNMLRYSDDPYSVISSALAFSSQSYFIRCFRKITGVTPYEYRMYHHRDGIRAAQGPHSHTSRQYPKRCQP